MFFFFEEKSIKVIISAHFERFHDKVLSQENVGLLLAGFTKYIDFKFEVHQKHTILAILRLSGTVLLLYGYLLILFSNYISNYFFMLILV